VLGLINIRVASTDLDHLNLYWETASGDDPLDYSFQILRSEARFGPYEAISGVFRDRYHYRDTTTVQLHLFRSWYYKIRVTHVGTQVSADYPDVGVALEAPPDLQALEMARMTRLRLQEFEGRQVWIFPRRTFGQRCSCVDSVTKSQIRSGCLTCYDVGFVGGYHYPIQAPMKIVSSTEATVAADAARFQDSPAQAKLANYPDIHEGDVVVELENIRWRVMGPINKEAKLRSTIFQQFALYRIPKDDVSYKLPIAVDLQKFKASPARQFTNPHHLEADNGFVVTATPTSITVVHVTNGPSTPGGIGAISMLAVTQKNALTGVNLPNGTIVALVPQAFPGAGQEGVMPASAQGSLDIEDPVNALSNVYGVVYGQITAGGSGQVIRFGKAQVIKAAVETWAAGAPIYLSTVAGKATHTAPQAAGTWVKLIGRAAEASSGFIGYIDFAPEPRVQN